MRSVAVLAVLTAACTSAAKPDEPSPDARPADAREHVDAASCADSTDPPDMPLGVTGTLASGTYTIAWQGVSGDFDNVNPLAGTDRLTVEVNAGTARYDSDTCAECTGQHHGSMTGSCMLVAGGADGDADRWPYYLCATATGVIANVKWCGYPGPPGPRVWRVTGEPVAH